MEHRRGEQLENEREQKHLVRALLILNGVSVWSHLISNFVQRPPGGDSLRNHLSRAAIAQEPERLWFSAAERFWCARFRFASAAIPPGKLWTWQQSNIVRVGQRKVPSALHRPPSLDRFEPTHARVPTH